MLKHPHFKPPGGSELIDNNSANKIARFRYWHTLHGYILLYPP